ncbi:MAG: hypothetical protein RIB49_15665 [Rhodospirillales bacterium]
MAPEFGISDVALKKTCAKYDIPVPGRGYWAKLTNGKRVAVKQLPTKRFALDMNVPIRRRDGWSLGKRARANAVPETIDVRKSQQKPENQPDCMREPKSVLRLEAALRKRKPDGDGFLNIEKDNLPRVSVGGNSIERAVSIFLQLLEVGRAIGVSTVSSPNGLLLVCNDEKFRLRIYETNSQKPHTPSRAELKAQAEAEERYKRYPSIYSGKPQAYRKWDPVPSGRISLEIRDPSIPEWHRDNVIGRWQDRKTKRVEDYLTMVASTLDVASSLIKERQKKEEEDARQRAEELERRHLEAEARERQKKLRELLSERAELLTKLEKLNRLRARLTDMHSEEQSEEFDQVIAELDAYISEMDGFLHPEGLLQEIHDKELV